MANIFTKFKVMMANPRTRLVAIVLSAVVIVGAGAFVLTLDNDALPGVKSSVISDVPFIRSVPGSTNPTEQYAKLQSHQNVDKAKEANKSGNSAIPTIIRTEEFGEGQSIPGQKEGDGGLSFSTLSRTGREGGTRKAWLDELLNSKCAEKDFKYAQGQGASLKELLSACSCLNLKNHGVDLSELVKGCECKNLKNIGYSARELKDEGFTARQLKLCGYSACEMRAAGFSAKELLEAGYSADELRGAGFNNSEINLSKTLPDPKSISSIRDAGCDIEQLKALRAQGVKAATIRRISGCSAASLRAAGYSAEELKEAGFSASELRAAGFSAEELRAAGFSTQELKAAGFSDAEIQAMEENENFPKDCIVTSLKVAYKNGILAGEIKRKLGCSAAAMKEAGYSALQLREAGYSALELKLAGFSAKELKAVGFTARELKNAGFDAKTLRDAGYSAKDLKEAGFDAKSLKNAGFSARELMEAGFTPQELCEAGFSPESLKAAGFSAKELLATTCFNVEQLKTAGFIDKDLGIIDEIVKAPPKQVSAQPVALKNSQVARRHQKKIQAAKLSMQSYARQILNEWQTVDAVMVESSAKDAKGGGVFNSSGAARDASVFGVYNGPAIIKAGDIHFAVLDTSVNSDEDGPVLAHIVQGPFKNSKIIGTLSRPANSQRVILRFNVMSIPGAPKTIPINAVAIDMDTARTALSSETDNHYLSRYGSLLASAFLEGFGNAFAATGSQVQVNGFNISSSQAKRSLGENTLVAFSEVGKKWGDSVGKNVDRAPTVHVFSGVGIGLLFMQDISDAGIEVAEEKTEKKTNG